MSVLYGRRYWFINLLCDKIKDKIDKIIRYDEIKTAAQTEGGEDDLQDQINPKPGLT